ncbi:MAG: cytochrome c biogenesis protein CcsA [Deltaproteobacteria bacterium]|nr:cytochrome c biogenesis protein CcsA [Deltaproteobacteria bacterium]MBW2445742.1 cytochrome c biogenesis protein CcsA [Deltaproteobacteria bacterium]
MNDPTETRFERRALAAEGPVAIALLVTSAIAALVIVRAPADVVQGVLYKILFVHAPAAFAAYLGFVLTAAGGALYLWKNDEQWDRLAVAAAEVGLLFCTLNIVTGPIWAKAAWGKAWVWDPRLVMTALLWLVYLAYGLLRSFSEEGPRAARFAAVYGIAGVLLIPLNYFAIDLFGGRALHPENLERQSLGVGIGQPFLAGTIATLVAFLYLLLVRFEVQGLRVRVERARLDEASGEAS